MTWRGRALRVLGVALALVAVFHLAGGWYFSGQIGSDVVLADNAVPPADLAWSFSGPDSVSIQSRLPGQELPREASLDAVYGLQGDGQQVVVDQVLDQSATTVQRRVATRDGAEYWTGGGLAIGPGLRRPTSQVTGSLQRDVWTDPTQIGLTYRDVTVDGPLGGLPAWYVPASGGPRTTWAVLVHGRGASRSEPLRALITAHRSGMPALVVTYRNDEGAPASPDGSYTFGTTEWEDLQASVQYALDRGATDVVLFGFSMGGAIVASFMERSPLADDVTAMVLDAPMLDIRRTIAFGASQRDLPVVGLPVPGSLTWTAEQLARLRYGSQWYDARYLDDTSWVRVPTLVIHGAADTTVPLATSQQLAAEVPDQVRLEVVPGAEHVESWNLGPDAYAAWVTSFLEDRVGCQVTHAWCA